MKVGAAQAAKCRSSKQEEKNCGATANRNKQTKKNWGATRVKKPDKKKVVMIAGADELSQGQECRGQDSCKRTEYETTI